MELNIIHMLCSLRSDHPYYIELPKDAVSDSEDLNGCHCNYDFDEICFGNCESGVTAHLQSVFEPRYQQQHLGSKSILSSFSSSSISSGEEDCSRMNYNYCEMCCQRFSPSLTGNNPVMEVTGGSEKGTAGVTDHWKSYTAVNLETQTDQENVEIDHSDSPDYYDSKLTTSSLYCKDERQDDTDSRKYLTTKRWFFENSLWGRFFKSSDSPCSSIRLDSKSSALLSPSASEWHKHKGSMCHKNTTCMHMCMHCKYFLSSSQFDSKYNKHSRTHRKLSFWEESSKHNFSCTSESSSAVTSAAVEGICNVELTLSTKKKNQHHHKQPCGHDDDKMVCLDVPMTNFGFYSGEVTILM